MKRGLLTILFVATCAIVMAQKENAGIIKGNEAYRQKEYAKAAEFYRKAMEQAPKNDIPRFNLANTLFRESRADEAIGLFEQVAKDANAREMRGSAHYNRGVVLTGQKKLPESIAAYKDALRLNPEDSLARQNLQRALREQQKQQQQNRQDQQQQKKKPEKLNKQQVQQMLNALQEQERLLQKKLNQSKVPSPNQPGKDW